VTRRLAHVGLAGALALTFALAPGCKGGTAVEKPAAEKGAAAPSGSTHAPIKVDRELLTQGRIKTALVERRAPRGELRVPGEVRSSESGSAEAGTLVSGRVASLEATEGTRVTKGQILAWVDAPEVGRATAELLRARARAAVAARKLERQLDLDKQQATSKNAVDDARADDLAARADLLAARTLLANLGGQEPPPDSERATAIVRVPVRSPIDGVVARRDAILGAPVSPEKSLFTVVAAGHVVVLARVPETSTVPPVGTKATLTARGGAPATCDANATGTLGAIDAATHTTAVRVEPGAACTWLVAGGYVDVTFPGIAAGEARDLVVPREAIVDVGGVPSAFVPGAAEGEFVQRAVRVRAGGEGPEIVVEAGLAEGDKIVVQGALLLKGEMIRSELQ
jgi:membrane fusion protein, heavy metal efflux system